MAKLTTREISALVAEVQKEIQKKNEEYRNSINLEDFDGELAVIHTIEQLEDSIERKKVEIQELTTAIIALRNDIGLGVVWNSNVSELSKKTRKISYLISKGLIQNNKVVSNIELENFFIINNNGDLSSLLELAKENFINQ